MSENNNSIDVDFTHRLKVFSATLDTFLQRYVRSVRIIIVNCMEFEFKLVTARMELVVWSPMVNSSIAPESIVQRHAHEPSNKVKDVSGSSSIELSAKIVMLSAAV